MATLDRGTDLVAVKAKLIPWLETKLPQAEAIQLSGLDRAAGGFVSDTHFFELSYRKDGQEYVESMVIRWPPEVAPAVPGHDMALACRLVKCLERVGLPVVNIRWFEEDKSILGFPFLIMEKIDGDAPPDFPPGFHGHGLFFDATPERREKMWWESVAAMARLHSFDWKAMEVDFLGVPKGGTDVIDREIDHWESLLASRAHEPVPVMGAAFDWLKQNRYEPKHLSLCWGDARPGNLIYRDDKVIAIVDWDLAYVGTPETDLAYFIFMDQQFAATYQLPRLEGLPGPEETIAYYEKVMGRKVENYHYHEVFATTIVGVMCVLAAEAVALSGGPKDMATNNYPTHRLREMLNLKDI